MPRIRSVSVGTVYLGCVKCILTPPLPGRDVCRRCDESPYIAPPSLAAALGRYAYGFLAARGQREHEVTA